MDDEILKHLENLAEYVDEDAVYQKYLDNEAGETSDFDMFCINHCIDIDIALDLIANLLEAYKKLEKERNAILEALSLVKQKKNNDKAKYRRKYKSLRDDVNEVIADIDRHIADCTAEAEGTINNEKCWMAVNYLKKLRSMLKK